MSLIEKIARDIADALGDNFDYAFNSKPEWTAARGETKAGYRDINQPFKSCYLEAAQAALTAMLEGFGGDGVTEGGAAEQAEAFGKAYRAEQLANYGCGGVVQCTYPHDGNCVCFNNTLARHRQLSAAAERARIVAWLRDRQRCWFEAADGYDSACEGAEASRLAAEGSAYREAADAIERGEV